MALPEIQCQSSRAARATGLRAKETAMPLWLTLPVAVVVILWGAYRIRIGLRSDEAEARAAEQKGLFAMPRRTHLLIGVVYLLLGTGLVLVSFGWNPLRSAVEETAPADPPSETIFELETRDP
jgi:hypothetical protein